MMYYEEFIGAIKIKDGLFIGDIQAVKFYEYLNLKFKNQIRQYIIKQIATNLSKLFQQNLKQDYEFIITNKVSHIINAAGKQVDNLLENIGIQYLTFYWQESDNQVLFDKNIETVNQIVDFIEEANERGESCLVHSIRGQSRSCCVLTAYFMRRYQWTLLKSLDYLNSRRPDLEIRSTFFDQLKNLESYLQQTGQGAISSDWNHSGQGDEAKILAESSPDEVLLRNTFLNAKQGQIPDYYLNIGKQQRIGGYSPYQKPVPTKIVWSDEVQNNKKKLIQVLNQNQTSGKKGQSVQYRKPSPSPFKRTHPHNQQQLKQFEQQKQKVPKQQDYIDSILKGSNKVFRKETGEEINEDDINCNQEQQNQQDLQQQTQIQQLGGSNRTQKNQQRQNESDQNKSPQNRTSNKINYGGNQEQDSDNNEANLMIKSLTNKDNSSRTGSTKDDSILQDKNVNDQEDGNKQQTKANVNQSGVANKLQNQSQKVVIISENQIQNGLKQVIKENEQQNDINKKGVKKQKNNEISQINNINDNIIDINDNYFIETDNVNNLINNGNFLTNNTSQNNKSLQESNQFQQGKQLKQQQNVDTSKILNYYKQVEDKKKNDQKQQQLNQQYQISQNMIQQNQMLKNQQQQQLTNSQLQEQQYGFSLQQNPLQLIQSQNAKLSSQNQVSNSQTLSKMLNKNNTYHHQDTVYQKAISKSFNQSKMKQEIVFGSSQYNFPKDLNNSLIKNDISDQKITRNIMKQKLNQQPTQTLPQPATYKYPIKANQDIFEKRPNSANILQQGRQINNGFIVLTNNFLMGNSNVNENENNNMFASNNSSNKRPSSTGGTLRSFSPGTKILKQQILPSNLKPQLIVSNQNGKKIGMRYPSPSINSSVQNTYQLSSTQKNKRK